MFTWLCSLALQGSIVVALLAIGPWIGLPLVMGLVINIGVRLIVFVVVVFRPPGVLYLGPSSDLNFNLLRLLRTDLLEVRIVHLLSPAAAASSDARWERYNGALDNWRTDDPYLWMEIVRGLMDDLAPLVVVDVRTLTRHVLLELEACVRATKVVKKMLVVTESGESPLLDRFQESVQTTPWPEAPVHLINEGHEFLFDIQQFLVRPNLNQDLQKTRPSDLVSEIRKVLSLPRVVW